MNSLKYKGFIGSVNFSEADGVFFGKIEGIDGLVNFEGASIKELTNATARCIPFNQIPFDDVCPVCGKKAKKVVLFAKAY